MEQRVKLTVFLLIQRMADEEQMDNIAMEAIDMYGHSQKMAKDRDYAEKAKHPNAVEEELFELLKKYA